MSDLIAVAYPDKNTAEAVRQRLAQLTLIGGRLEAQRAASPARGAHEQATQSYD